MQRLRIRIFVDKLVSPSLEPLRDMYLWRVNPCPLALDRPCGVGVLNQWWLLLDVLQELLVVLCIRGNILIASCSNLPGLIFCSR